MASTLDDTKRLSIATKLADMKALQNLLINNEQQFIQDCTDEQIRKRLQNLLEDDRRNMGARPDGCFQLHSSKQANLI